MRDPSSEPLLEPPPPVRRGALAALAPLPLLLLPYLLGADQRRGEALGLILGLLLLLGAYQAARRPLVGLGLAALSALGFGLAALPTLARSPGLALATGLAWGVAIGWSFLLLEPPGLPRPRPRRSVRELEVARGACAGALGTWALAVPAQLAITPFALGWSLLALLGATVAALVWAWRAPGLGRLSPSRALAGVVLITALIGGLALLAGQPRVALTSLALPALAAVLITSWARRAPILEGGAWWEQVLEDPARLLVITFLLTGLGGGVLLALPAASSDGRGVPLLDALFTSFSACCVTGLATLDTASAWSGLGKLLILLLIQVGGLGIMTFSSAGLVILGRRLTLRQEGAVLATLDQEDRRHLRDALLRTVGVTLVLEAGGALALALLFAWAGEPGWTAVWKGVFHAVSAYCNAGFALQTDSLIPYQEHTLLMQVVGLLIIAGGLGPVIVADLPQLLRRRRASVQTRLALTVTAVLLVAPALVFLLVERRASMEHLSPLAQLNQAWFLSVTARTAGFNATDMSQLAPPSLALLLLLMFVGGSPGSTAGGIKTTTFGLLVLAVVGALRGRNETEAFGFRIAQASLYKAVATTALGMASVVAATLALLLTQSLDLQVALFEAVSALGTVGLTIGGTSALDSVGKVIVIVCMFAGRVGPLSLLLLLANRQDERGWIRPETVVAAG